MNNGTHTYASAFVDLATYSDNTRDLYQGEYDVNLYRPSVPISTSSWNARISCPLHRLEEDTLSFHISRESDLVTHVWVEITLPALPHRCEWRKHLGHYLFKSIIFRLNEDVIQRFTPEILDARMAFTQDDEYFRMISAHGTEAQTILLPIPFFFSNTSSDALLLSAIPYQVVTLDLILDSIEHLVIEKTNDEQLNKPDLLHQLMDGVQAHANGIIVTEEERKNITLQSHVKVMEQDEIRISSSPTVDLQFNYPVKVLYFMVREKGATDYIKLKGGIRLYFEETIRFYHPAHYFSQVQPYQQPHTHIPKEDGYHFYSFAQDLTSLQPTGSPNFGGLTNVSLEFDETLPRDKEYEFIVIATLIRTITYAKNVYLNE